MKRIISVIVIVMLTLVVRAVDATPTRPMLSRLLMHNTVRIETQKADGTQHVGTGFFYSFGTGETNRFIPVVVTCWHLVSNSTLVRMNCALASSNAFSRAQDHFSVMLQDGEKAWIRHPDTNIDLAVMPLAPAMDQIKNQGKRLEFAPITEEIIPDEAQLTKYGVFQEVKFIGYPIGIWDQKNNLPIVRRGMTATDPIVDYNGKPEFLIDAAVFPGSSGSPVFIAEENGGTAGGLHMGSRIAFLGILYAVHQYTSQGRMEIVTIPTAFDARIKTDMPANLGLVIKANQLAGFKTSFKEIEKKLEEMKKTGTAKPQVTTSP